jgi:hypothetical protein
VSYCMLFYFTRCLCPGAALGPLSLVEPAQAWLEDPAGADMAMTQQAFHGSPLPNRFLAGTASPRSPLPGSHNEVSAHRTHLHRKQAQKRRTDERFHSLLPTCGNTSNMLSKWSPCFFGKRPPFPQGLICR